MKIPKPIRNINTSSGMLERAIPIQSRKGATIKI